MKGEGFRSWELGVGYRVQGIAFCIIRVSSSGCTGLYFELCLIWTFTDHALHLNALGGVRLAALDKRRPPGSRVYM